MLPRAARRKNVLHHLQLSTEQLAPRPSRRPAMLRFHSQSTRPTAIASLSPPAPKDHPLRSSYQTSRHLATTTDHSAVDQGSYVPFDNATYSMGSNYEQSGRWGSSQSFSDSDPEFDTSSLIIIDSLLTTKPRVLRKLKGIGGDVDEMMANLDMSLKVGRFDRAAALIQRLGKFYPFGSPEYLGLHNRYLEGMVSHMIMTRQDSLVLPLQRWFEVDMVAAGVKPDATTYANMIRMALRMLHGSKRDRTVRRYWEKAKQAEIEEEVLALPILSELELGELSEICSSDLQRVAIGNMGVESFSPHAGETHEPDPVRPVPQKGFGLETLQESLSLFAGKSEIEIPPHLEVSEADREKFYQQLRQQRLEADAVRSCITRWRREVEELKSAGVDTTAGGKKLGSIINQWHSDLVQGLKKELELVAEAEANPTRTRQQRERCEYGVYLRCMDLDKLAAIAILQVLAIFNRAGMEKGLKLATLASFLGKEIQDEMIAEAVLKKDAQADDRRKKILSEILGKRKQRAGRAQWKKIVQQTQESDPNVTWPPRVAAKVGAVMMSLLFETAKVPITTVHPETKKTIVSVQPAFQHAYQISKGRRIGLINLHPELVLRITKEPPTDLIARHLPMVCEPKPWNGFSDGGYLGTKSTMMRITPGDPYQGLYLKAALEDGGLEKVREGLDVLGKTPWVINREVFDIMLEAWNSGEPIANFPALEPDLPIPPKPEPGADPEAERKWARAVREVENKRAGLHSTRCFQNFQMEIARAYRNETFYLPHNLDFRGRAYPIPPYLNQMGADNARGLLLFKDGKLLGARGLQWLKIHLANVYGFDKASLQEREKFADDHIDDILDSANKGLHGKRWWLEAEDPWQCLAACIELKNALRLPDPTQYESRLPIHQDGSCNGLQHYAALGGDIVGAKQVNLEPSDRPSDVYTGVAEFVKEAIAQEAAEGVPIAKILNGKITRKIVKQTVMTNVYGVTFIGASRQVRRQLVDYYPELEHECGHDKASVYIARKIFDALGSMFNGAHKIQYWLGDCANRITQSLSPEQVEELAKTALTPDGEPAVDENNKKSAKAKDPTTKFRSTVVWTTPLGLPVVQPYRVTKARRIKTSMQELSIMESSWDDVVSKRKQLQAFPPNFIHSLDATHMILSATECHRHGLTFSAVHDSFWTHAADVDVMNRVLRDAFIRMHSDDVVKRLASEFKARYGNHLFLAKVPMSSAIGKAITKYRKSSAARKPYMLTELFDEHKRQILLKSEDPELQKQGREMVTPAAIFEQLNGQDSDLVANNSLGESAVGHVPEDLEAAKRKANKDPALTSLLPDLDPQASGAAFEGAWDAEDSAGAEMEADADASEKGSSKSKKQTRSQWLWLPMRFPEVPSKGDWDVTRLRDSVYFFS
ncbi:hypothetical protein VTN00DRAFT_3858 [Thermoascus crustaceus]|uniref:uncharacterized protein n=1 Tax=Thermoascus crustaceus TaxID=5088 RepID=UPI00374370FE